MYKYSEKYNTYKHFWIYSLELLSKCIYFCYNRGTTFRPSYRRLKELVAVLSDAPVLMLTATATEELFTDIVTTLGINDVQYVSYLPDRYH